MGINKKYSDSASEICVHFQWVHMTNLSHSRQMLVLVTSNIDL